MNPKQFSLNRAASKRQSSISSARAWLRFAFAARAASLCAAASLLAGCAVGPKIHLAARQGDLEQVRREVEKGVDVNLKIDRMGIFTPILFGTPLHQAAWSNQTVVAEWLLAHGAQVNTRSKGGHTPLFWAVQQRHMEMLQLLLAHHADPNLAEDHGYTPLHFNIATNYSKSVTLALLKGGANANAATTSGATPLYLTFFEAREHIHEVAAMLLEAGANPNSPFKAGWRPLHIAAEQGDWELIHMLLKHGADIDAVSDTGATALFQAACFSRGAIVDMLLEQKPDLEKRDNGGERTALIAAAGNGSRDICNMLIRAGAKLTPRDVLGNTALGAALKTGHLETAEVLVNAGATYPLATMPVDERYFSALYQKMLADKQRTEKRTAEAKENYSVALASLTAVREEFIKTAALESKKAAWREFWITVGQGMAAGLGAAGAQYSSYQSYKSTAQISALRHSSSPGQYSAQYNSAMNQYQPAPITYDPIQANAVNIPPSEVERLRAAANVLRQKASICDRFIRAINSELRN